VELVCVPVDSHRGELALPRDQGLLCLIGVDGVPALHYNGSVLFVVG
jgi:hypothetical protein